MISAANVTMQFAAKPLFENISVKFGDGNRYGLIGANGCGKSTFMKILDGSLIPSTGNVSTSPNERVGRLNQDQFAFEEFSVIDTVIMGHKELWEVKQERDRIYGLPEMSEEDGMKVAELVGDRTRLEAACTPRSSFIFRSGSTATRRTNQQPRHQRHSLARRGAQPAPLDDDYHLARSSLPQFCVHTHGGYRLR